jgi:hypothetical protein
MDGVDPPLFLSGVWRCENFLNKWKEGMQSENVLVRYKIKEFTKIIESAETIKEFDRIFISN